MVMSQPSPYTPGEVARAVVGRGLQLSYFDERIQYMSTLGRLSARIRVDHASRGIVKTSLLREAQRRMEAAKVRTVWVTANPDESLAGSILAKLPETVKNKKTKLFAGLMQSIESATISLGVPGVASGSVSVRKGRPKERPNAAEEFKQAIMKATKAIAADGGTGLAILIDEIQSADPNSLRVISYAWQELASEQPDTPSGVFAVGLPNAPEEITKAVTFSERFEYRPLQGLPEADAELALSGPARELDVTWTRDALRFGAEASLGYPHKIQLIGHETWTAAGYPDAGFTIKAEHVQAGLIGVDQQMEELFKARWNSTSAAQRNMLVAIAKLGGENIERGAVAEAMGQSTIAISSTRHKLLEKGLIESERYGRMSFSVPGFTEWILDHEIQ
jgi:hypothetical protein